jgi:hypothetical protein
MASTNRSRSPAARTRLKRARRRTIKATVDHMLDQMAEAQDRYLAGDFGELSDFELSILEVIHGDV